jgi:hypothetical protein
MHKRNSAVFEPVGELKIVEDLELLVGFPSRVAASRHGVVMVSVPSGLRIIYSSPSLAKMKQRTV